VFHVAGVSYWTRLAAANAVLDVPRRIAPRVTAALVRHGWARQEVGLAADRIRQTLQADAARAAARDERLPDADSTPIDHPVFRSRVRAPDGDLVYRGVLRSGFWLVDDHLLDGRPLLSGTTTLQLARTAFLDHSTDVGAVELSRVVFLRPLFVAEGGMEIELRFSRSRDDEAFTLRSRAATSRGEWQVNSTGYVRRTAASPRPVPGVPPVHRWQEATARRNIGGARLTVGPRWQWPRLELEHEGRVWDRLALPPAFAADVEVFDLHPALLDAATVGAARRMRAESVPHTYDCIRIFAGLIPNVLALAVERDAGTSTATDITITDLDGTTLVEIEGYVMRPIEGSSLSPGIREQRSPGDMPSDPGSGSRRVVIGESGTLDSLRAKRACRGPGAWRVRIEVHATGLNFRDVLSALGQMPGRSADGARRQCNGIVGPPGPGCATRAR
jgi:hypothetical protein